MTADSDERPDEGAQLVVASPMHLINFEGTVVRHMEGKLPAMAMEMSEGYKRGTILRLAMEVRVKNVSYDEDKNGELTRVHKLALEGATLVSAYQPEDERGGVGGGLASGAIQPDDGLGIGFGRTGDKWGNEDSDDRS